MLARDAGSDDDLDEDEDKGEGDGEAVVGRTRSEKQILLYREETP